MLEDSLGLLQEEAERNKLLPLYDIKDWQATLEHFAPVNYYRKIQPKSDITLELLEAGHILGSSLVRLTLVSKIHHPIRVVFSGDLGNPAASLLRQSDVIEQADYLIIESAYGDRMHETKQERKDILENIIEDTIKRGGVLMIPAFAVERVQEILFELNNLVEQGRIPTVPVFLDSPLAIKATAIYKKYQSYFNKETQELIAGGEEIFSFPGLKLTNSVEESKAINDVAGPKIIIAGAGNLSGGRILHHAKRYLPDSNNAILIVGYQHIGSLGRQLVDGASEVQIFGEVIPVRATVAKIDGYSSHGDQGELLKFIAPMHQTLKKVFVVQGEEKASQILAQKIQDEFAVTAEVPKLGSEFVLV